MLVELGSRSQHTGHEVSSGNVPNRTSVDSQLPLPEQVSISGTPERRLGRAGQPGLLPTLRGGHMRVMVIVKATKESEAESHPLEAEGAEEMFAQMGKFNEELIKAGIMLAGNGLKPSKFGKRIHFDGTKRSVTDGPFTETKEL